MSVSLLPVQERKGNGPGYDVTISDKDVRKKVGGLVESWDVNWSNIVHAPTSVDL